MSVQIYQYFQLMRIDKPIGILLLLWPTLIALTLANHGHPPLSILIVFTLGVFFVRSAGCVINDIVDRNYDPHVARTASRPLAVGKITMKEAWIVSGFLLIPAATLLFFLNNTTRVMAVIAVVLTVFYPFCKRWTYFPQVWLGVVFNWGIVMAYTQAGVFPFSGFLLYLSAVLMTVVYDTMYAMADKEDDLRIGVKSTAIRFGQYDRLIIGVFQGIAWCLLLIVGLLTHQTVAYYIGLGLCAVSLVYQQYLIKERAPSLCFRAFLHANWVWIWVLLGVIYSA